MVLLVQGQAGDAAKMLDASALHQSLTARCQALVLTPLSIPRSVPRLAAPDVDVTDASSREVLDGVDTLF
jgi:hypothetical protein